MPGVGVAQGDHPGRVADGVVVGSALVAALAEAGTDAPSRASTFLAPLRAALAGRSSTPSVFDMMLALGRDEALARLEDQAG